MTHYLFKNEQPAGISSGAPNQIASAISVTGALGSVQDVKVKLDIDHTYTQDLQVQLVGPQGAAVTLVSGRGGRGDDFDETVFDDDAATAIRNGSAPFRGTFRPEEPLSAFNDSDANGDWTLRVNDQAFRDGGALNRWELSITTDHEEPQTGPFMFRNQTPRIISAGAPNTVESEIEVMGLDGVRVRTLRVTLDIDHTFTGDLAIHLLGPDGREVLLVGGEGGREDNFRETMFDDDAAEAVTDASAPFRGVFRPEGRLADFAGTSPNGIWKLRIRDQANFDGGTLNSWSLMIESDAQPELPERPFRIHVRFMGGLTPSQEAIFQEAADRWSEVIVGNLPAFDTDIGRVDDLVIDALGIAIDGPGGILGQAGPTRVRPGSLLPARGIMQFDSADIQQLENSGELIDVIIHEMGHVLGIGTLWTSLGLLQGSGTDEPQLTGMNSMREYSTLIGASNPTPVPVENMGGEGTREGHWRESVFDTELMTGFDDPGRNALSRLTVASLQDIGYQVNYEVADIYFLPFQLLSRSAVEAKAAHQCRIACPKFEVLPEEKRIP